MRVLGGELVTVIGGSGFIGRHTVRALASKGYRIRVAVRRPDLAGHLQPLGAVGQIAAVQANVRHPRSLAAACKGANAVINLAGVLYDSGKQTFDAVHVQGARAVAVAAREAGASKFIHLSAIGANVNSPSRYGRTKAAGELHVQEAFARADIIRPSVVFGPEDNFFNRFANLARWSPVLPVIGGATKLQPVFVGNVAEAVAKLIDKPYGAATFELGGPDVLSFEDVLRFVLRVSGRSRLLARVPFPVATLQAAILELLPNPPFTSDQLALLRSDNIVSEQAKINGHTLEGLGVSIHSIAAVVPGYLYRYRRSGQFSTIESPGT